MIGNFYLEFYNKIDIDYSYYISDGDSLEKMAKEAKDRYLDNATVLNMIVCGLKVQKKQLEEVYKSCHDGEEAKDNMILGWICFVYGFAMFAVVAMIGYICKANFNTKFWVLDAIFSTVVGSLMYILFKNRSINFTEETKAKIEYIDKAIGTLEQIL